MVSPRETRSIPQGKQLPKGNKTYFTHRHSLREIKPICPIGFSPRESISARETNVQIM